MTEQPDFFYYLGDRRVPLEMIEDTLVVALNQPISARRLAGLQASDNPVEGLGANPGLTSRNMLIYRTMAAGRGMAGVRAFADRLSRAPSVRFVTSVFRNRETGLFMILTDEIIVRFKPDTTEAQIAAINAQHGTEIIDQQLDAPHQMRLRVLQPLLQRALDIANAYHESDLVEWAEPNFVMEARVTLQQFEWHLRNDPTRYAAGVTPGVTGEDSHVLAAGLTGSAEVVIAILDSGVDLPDPANPADTGHPGLTNLLVEQARNFSPGGATTARPDNDPSGSTGHGTCCAGVAAGVGGKIDGAAPGSKILPIKIMTVSTTGTTTSFLVDNALIANAFRYSAQHAQVLSNSWFAGLTSNLTQAISDVATGGRDGKGTIILFATGNDNLAMNASGPARLPGVIAIGASTNVGSRAGYSNFGESLDRPPAQKRVSVLAPSNGTSSNPALWKGELAPVKAGKGPFEDDGSTEQIYTTDQRGAQGFNPNNPADRAGDGDYTAQFGGTSSATPLAAGICALMLAANPDLTRAQVKYILEATADKIGTGQPRVDVPPGNVPAGKQAGYNGEGHDPKFGFGRVNAEQAVKVARGEGFRQLIDRPGGLVYQDAVPVILRRKPGTNEFVSDELELADARRESDRLPRANPITVRAAPGGFVRATFQPVGGAPLIADEIHVLGEPS